MSKQENILITKLNAFKKKYYQNKLLKGAIFLVGASLSIYLIFNSLEFVVGFGSAIRAVLFFSFIGITLFVGYKWIYIPLSKLLALNKAITNKEAAQQIGNYFPEIKDRLLNTLQLQEENNGQNELISASIAQRTKTISVIPFSNAISFNENKKHLKYLLVPAAITVLLLILAPSFLKENTNKIIQYNNAFIPRAPFQFILENIKLQAFKNEDYTVSLNFSGAAIPEAAYIISGGRKIKMHQTKNGQYKYDYLKIQKEETFVFEAAGFSSQEYKISVISRPNLKNFSVDVRYPKYVKRKNESFKNTGNLQVPEGTKITWQFNTLAADKLIVSFEKEKNKKSLQPVDNQLFTINHIAKYSQDYTLKLENKYGSNKEAIQYHVEVTPDQYPKINLEQFQDTTLFSFMVLGGNISDDYGLSKLNVFYKVIGENKNDNQIFSAINVPINNVQINQSFFYKMTLDSLNLKEGEKVEYYLKVWDNDGVNGRKSVKTAHYFLDVPTKKELKENLSKSSENAEKQLDKTLKKAKELKERLKKEQDKLKTKMNLQWEDKKRLEDILKKRDELNKAVEKLKEINESNDMKRERFDKSNEKIQEKAKQLQNLMNELLDEETKKLYEELQKLLEENRSKDEVQELLDKLDNKEENLEKELERALELFKKMKFDYKLDDNIKELDELTKEQETLAEETLEKDKKKEELSDNQEDMNKRFEDFKKEMEELNEMNQDRKNPESMPDTSEEESEVEKSQEQSKEELDKGKKKKASKSQKNAAGEMKKMAVKMKQMQSGMEMEMMMENLDDMRAIVDNLVTLSFNQESLMGDFKKVKQSDPRFVTLSQEQLKLKDDSEIIQDSLLALAERVFQIQSFVTRELDEMTQHMDETSKSLKERKKSQAVSHQQFTMTSINNLALLLDDVLKQMQQQMADAKGMGKKGGKGKKNQPGLSDLQKQLNKQIQQLKKSGKSGRALSQELAKLAAEQERLRNALKEMEGKFGKGGKGSGKNGGKDGKGDGEEEGKDGKKGGKGMKELLDKMEKTEEDLVNKRLSSEMMERQKEILTRLLEAENALRERELDDKRKAEKAKSYEKRLPKAFEEYIKAKEKEIELLKTVPLKLNPYYKKEVQKYFDEIEK